MFQLWVVCKWCKQLHVQMCRSIQRRSLLEISLTLNNFFDALFIRTVRKFTYRISKKRSMRNVTIEYSRTHCCCLVLVKNSKNSKEFSYSITNRANKIVSKVDFIFTYIFWLIHCSRSNFSDLLSLLLLVKFWEKIYYVLLTLQTLMTV